MTGILPIISASYDFHSRLTSGASRTSGYACDVITKDDYITSYGCLYYDFWNQDSLPDTSLVCLQASLEQWSDSYYMHM